MLRAPDEVLLGLATHRAPAQTSPPVPYGQPVVLTREQAQAQSKTRMASAQTQYPRDPGPGERANPPEGWTAAFAALRERIDRLETDVRQLQTPRSA